MTIRIAHPTDFDQIWPIFQDVARAGDTYGYDPEIDREQAFELWMTLPKRTYVIEADKNIVGSYYIKTNQAGPGRHVCNCGYMISAQARGKGLARALCSHSQKVAKELGYRAMQFNFVASTNHVAVQLWHKMGFETVGTLPNAFAHPHLGLVDALVMYKWLHNE